MERIEFESFWLLGPYSADVFVEGQALKCLQTVREVVGADEVIEMCSKLVIVVIVIAFDRCLLDRPFMRSTWSLVHGWFGLPSNPDCKLQAGSGGCLSELC